MKINKLLFGMLLLLLASCGSSRKVEKQSEQVAVQEINLTPEQQRKYDYFFLEASRLKVKKEYTAAFDLLQHCLAINPSGSVSHPGTPKGNFHLKENLYQKRSYHQK